jgi:hypothetical protein
VAEEAERAGISRADSALEATATDNA